MSLSAAALEIMLAKGLTLADVVDIARVMEADDAPRPLSAGAQRTRKYRARKSEDVTGDVTVTRHRDEQSVSPTPPSEKTPFPPLKGGTSPKSATPPAKPLAAEVEEIWALMGSPAKSRTSRADIERTLRSALRRDHTAADVIAGLAAYYASPDATKDGGKFAKGAHRMIENDRWESFEPEPEPPPDRDPWPQRLREFHRNGYWNTTDWGPSPGRPGCNAPQLETAA